VFFKVNKETPTTQQETNPPMPAASSTGLFSSSEDAAPLTTRTFRILAGMFLDDDFACRFAEEEEEEKRKRVCDWETEEIEDNGIRCIMKLYCLCACVFHGAFPRECVCFCSRARKVINPPVSDIRYVLS
jgi:hypothetical protein